MAPLKKFPVLVIVVSLLGCSDQGTSPVDLEHFRLWKSLDVHDYVIEQQRQCFCPDGGRIVEIVIRADTIASIAALDTLQPPVQSGPYLSVNGLFEYIISARAQSASSVEVTYNEQYGYPERIFVDWIAAAVDDEVGYLTLNFRTVRP